MITTTIESLLTIKPVLQKLANTSMPAREAFSILKMLKLIDKEYESIEAVQRKMLDTYGAKNEDGTFTTDEKGNYIIKKEGIEDYIAELLEQELFNKGIKTEENDSLNDFLFFRKDLPDNQWDFDVIDMICNHFEEINLENCNYKEEK